MPPDTGHAPRPRRLPAAAVTVGLAVALVTSCSSTGSSGASTTLPPVVSGGSTSPATTPTAPATTTAPPVVPASQANVLANLPGPTDGSCADTAGRNVRSGTIGAGDFLIARDVYKAGGTGTTPATVSLHVIPANPGTMVGVTVMMTRQRNPVIMHTYTSTTHESAGGIVYYVVSMVIDGIGPWKLDFTAGTDHGCFISVFNRTG